jgi:hypothetical protein
MNELFPILFGSGVGLVCSFVSPRRWRCGFWFGSSVVLGVTATILSGESRSGWEFLLIDIPAVAASSFAMIILRNTTGQATAKSLRL